MADLSQLSDEQLMELYNKQQSPAPQSILPQQDLSQLSDEQLMQMYSGGNSEPSVQDPQPENLPGTWLSRNVGKPIDIAGRGIIKGVTAVPAMAADFGTFIGESGANAATGKNVHLTRPSEYIEQGLDWLKPEAKPQGASGRILENVISAIGGTKTLTSAAQAASPGRLSRFLGSNPELQGRAAIGSAAAASTTQEAGGGPLAQIGAGLLGGGLSAKALSPKSTNVIPTAEDTAANASALYKKADEVGGILSPNITNKWLDDIEGFTPQTEAGKLIAGDDATSKIIGRLRALKDKTIDLKSAQEIDEYLSEAVDGFTEMGRVTKQGKKILDIQSSLRGLIDNLEESDVIGGKQGFEALKAARSEWSKAAKLRDIERIISRAEQMDNPATGIKSGFRTLYNNPARMRGAKPEERAAIKKAAESGIVTDALRTFGSKLTGVISLGTGNPALGAANYAAGAVARGAAERVQMNKAKKIAEVIANRGQQKVKQPSKLAPFLLGTAQGIAQ